MIRPTMTRLITLLSLIAAFSLAGCNTVEGVGEDVQSAGEAVEDAAD